MMKIKSISKIFGVLALTLMTILVISNSVLAWDLSTAVFVDRFSVAGEELTSTSLAFNTDGTKMFVVGNTGDDVNEYNLSTGFDVSTASFVDSFSVAGQDTDPADVVFSTDGTKMFVVGNTGDDVNEYNLSTGFDVSTASFVDSFSVAGQDTTPTALAFSTDGTKMFMGGSGDGGIYQYTLSTGFDVSTAAYDDVVFYNDDEFGHRGLFFKPGGLVLYDVGAETDTVYQYTLTSAFDITGMTETAAFSIAAQDNQPEGLAFNTDGSKMFVLGATGDNVNEYSLTPPATAPDAPTSPSATAISDTHIDLSWTAPDDGGSALTGYKIERKVAAGAYSTLVADTGTTATTYSDTGLTASTLYTYKISATNAIGTGSASAEASGTTSPAPTGSAINYSGGRGSDDADDDEASEDENTDDEEGSEEEVSTLTQAQREAFQRQINEIREIVNQLIEIVRVMFGITL